MPSIKEQPQSRCLRSRSSPNQCLKMREDANKDRKVDLSSVVGFFFKTSTSFPVRTPLFFIWIAPMPAAVVQCWHVHTHAKYTNTQWIDGLKNGGGGSACLARNLNLLQFFYADKDTKGKAGLASRLGPGLHQWLRTVQLKLHRVRGGEGEIPRKIESIPSISSDIL